MERALIVFDGTSWFVRRVRAIEHDLALDEKVYHCDDPIGKAHATLDEAVATMRAYQKSRMT